MRHLGDLKRVLLSLLAVGALGWVTIPRTYAVFDTGARNPGNSLATGTLVLGNVANGGRSCLSNDPGSSGNVNAGCDTLMTYDPAAEHYPGDAGATATVAVTDGGSLDGTDLRLWMPSDGGCTSTPTGDAPAASQGGGNPCTVAGAVALTVQETNQSGTATRCWYPNGGTTCTPDAANDLAAFVSGHADSGSALDLGAGPAAGQTRYFTIGLAFPSSSPASVQGEEVLFELDWYLTNG